MQPIVSDKEFGRSLRAYRTAAGYSQTKLARKVGLDESLVSRLETGKRTSSRTQVLAIAEALQLRDAQTDNLLIAGGYAPESRSVLRLIAQLDDPAMPKEAKEALRKTLADLVEGLNYFVLAKGNLDRRDWEGAEEPCSIAQSRIEQSLRRLRAYILDVQGTACYHRGKLPEAKVAYELSAADAEASKDTVMHAFSLVRLGDLAMIRNDWEAAKSSYEQARAISEKREFGVGTALALKKLGTALLYQGLWEQAELSLTDSLDLFRAVGSLYGRAKVHYLLAWSHNLSGRWDKSLNHLEEGLRIASLPRESSDYYGAQHPDKYTVLKGQVYLADTYRRRGELDAAEATFLKARVLWEQLRQEKVGVYGMMTLGLARLCMKRGKWDDAHHSIAESESFYQELENKTKLATVLNVKGELCLQQGDLDKAKHCIQDACRILRSVWSPYDTTDALVNLCDVCGRLGNFENMEQYAQTAEKLAREYHFYKHLARLKAVTGRAWADRGNNEQAIADYCESLVAATHYNHFLVEEVNGRLYETLRRMGTGGAREFYSAFDRELRRARRRYQREGEEVAPDTPTGWVQGPLDRMAQLLGHEGVASVRGE